MLRNHSGQGMDSIYDHGLFLESASSPVEQLAWTAGMSYAVAITNQVSYSNPYSDTEVQYSDKNEA